MGTLAEVQPSSDPAPVPAFRAIAWRQGKDLPLKRPHTVADLVEAATRKHGGQTVLIEGASAWSWDRLQAGAASLAKDWAEAVQPGARVAILVGNGAAHLLAELAAWRLGAIPAPIFTGWGSLRVAELLARIDPSLVVVPPGGTDHRGSWRVVTDSDVLARANRPERGPERPVDGDDPALLLFTSGSTGEPRAVTLSHGNLASQQSAFGQLWPEIGPGDRLASYLPWHHSFGALAERFWALCRGATVTLVPGGGRDHHLLLTTVSQVRPTVFMSVPKIHAVVAASGVIVRDLRFAFTAGAPLSDRLAAWWRSQGVPLYEGWGLTETSPSATITPPGQGWRSGIVGEPIPGVGVGIDGDGRILVRGPNVMLGYWNDAKATAAVLRREADGTRIVDSGDLGGWEADGLRLDGRSDCQVKLANGEKISVAAIERRLEAQAAIAHAVVVAAPELTALVEPSAPEISDRDLSRAVGAADAQAASIHESLAAGYRITAPLGTENGGLTSSLKVARGVVLARFNHWRAQGGSAFRPIG